MKKNIKPKVKEYLIAESGSNHFQSITSFSLELALYSYIEKYFRKIKIQEISNIRIELASNRKTYTAAVVSKRYWIDYFIIRC